MVTMGEREEKEGEAAILKEAELCVKSPRYQLDGKKRSEKDVDGEIIGG